MRMTMTRQMSKSPEAVLSFLSELTTKIREKCRYELSLLQKAKQSRERNDTIYNWDILHYKNDIQSKTVTVDGISKDYLDVASAINGMGMICNRLFGLELARVPMETDETWSDDVIKTQIRKPGGETIGTIYLDLFPRSGKFTHSASFPIQFHHLAPSSYGNDQYTEPRVALVCNFNATNSRNELALSLQELEVLYHEFGHCLAIVLCKSNYQVWFIVAIMKYYHTMTIFGHTITITRITMILTMITMLTMNTIT